MKDKPMTVSEAGRKGGKARMAMFTPEELKAYQSKIAKNYWKKRKALDKAKRLE